MRREDDPFPNHRHPRPWRGGAESSSPQRGCCGLEPLGKGRGTPGRRSAGDRQFSWVWRVPACPGHASKARTALLLTVHGPWQTLGDGPRGCLWSRRRGALSSGDKTSRGPTAQGEPRTLEMEAREPLQGQLALGNHGQSCRLPSPGRKGATPLVLLSQTCPPYSSERSWAGKGHTSPLWLHGALGHPCFNNQHPSQARAPLPPGTAAGRDPDPFWAAPRIPGQWGTTGLNTEPRTLKAPTHFLPCC